MSHTCVKCRPGQYPGEATLQVTQGVWCSFLIAARCVLSDNAESNANNSLKYVPGKARSHHLQMMLSKDELEEEQRVQQEQLAAIFQLLQDNKETFGEVSEGDMEEQLRLYSI
uniref:Matrix-remodeling-associated protein 7 helical domain-containing protein n=1 Tax=Anabas testudineus TaxID=64144 RepID=A0A7N6C2S2_ANATE